MLNLLLASKPEEVDLQTSCVLSHLHAECLECHYAPLSFVVSLPDVTYLLTGLDPEHNQMLFMAPSREAKRQVQVPMSALKRGRLTLRTDLVDVYLYIFTKQTVFGVLEARPNCQSIKQVCVKLPMCSMHGDQLARSTSLPLPPPPLEHCNIFCNV